MTIKKTKLNDEYRESPFLAFFQFDVFATSWSHTFISLIIISSITVFTLDHILHVRLGIFMSFKI